jgi:DNA-directed RNA polymerase subunit beta'
VQVNLKSLRREISYFTERLVHIYGISINTEQISYLLGLTNKELERIIYYENYVAVNPVLQALRNDLITEDEYLNALNNLPEEQESLMIMMKINSSKTVRGC